MRSLTGGSPRPRTAPAAPGRPRARAQAHTQSSCGRGLRERSLLALSRPPYLALLYDSTRTTSVRPPRLLEGKNRNRTRDTGPKPAAGGHRPSPSVPSAYLSMVCGSAKPVCSAMAPGGGAGPAEGPEPDKGVTRAVAEKGERTGGRQIRPSAGRPGRPLLRRAGRGAGPVAGAGRSARAAAGRGGKR